MKMTIGVSLVTYNNDENQIQKLHDSLKSYNFSYIVVYDNSPTNYLEKIFINLGWDYIWGNGINLGFGKAHNFLFCKYGNLAQYHLIINPDIKFDKNVLIVLSKFLHDTFDAGCVMPKVLYPNETSQYLAKYLPSFFDLIFRRFPIEYIRNYVDNKLEIRYQYDKGMKPFKMPFLSGCFLLFKSKVIDQVGFFDERYFLYAEDLDLTRTYWNSGFYPYCYPSIHVYHNYEKASSKNMKLFLVHIISVLKYFKKWGFIDKSRKKINLECKKQFIS